MEGTSSHKYVLFLHLIDGCVWGACMQACVFHGVGVWKSGQLYRVSFLWVLGIHFYPGSHLMVSLYTLLNKMSTFTVGKPCCVLSFTEPRLPSVRYRARCWVSGCTTIFSSFPSLLTGYCPHNIGLFFTPVPFWLSNVLRNQSTAWKKISKTVFYKSYLDKGRNRKAITLKIIAQITDKIEYSLKEETSYITKVSLKYFEPHITICHEKESWTGYRKKKKVGWYKENNAIIYQVFTLEFS